VPQGATTEPHGHAGEHDDASAPRSHAPARLFGRGRALLLAAIVVLFAVALISGRALEPALLGWRTGIEQWIDRCNVAAAYLGQLAVVSGGLLAVQLLIGILVESNLSMAYRLVAAPITAGIITLVMAASARDLPVLLLLALAILSGLMALLSSVPAVIVNHGRAAGLVLAIAGWNALLAVTARALAVWASDRALTSWFHAARVIATVSLVLDVIALAIAGFWLSERRWRIPALVGPVVLGGAVGLAAAAVRGTGAPEGWTVLASKAVTALVRHPWPLVPAGVGFAVELALVLMSLAMLVARRDQPYARSAIALALLARAGTDIPVLALALLLAALMGALAASRRPEPAVRSEPAPRPSSPASAPEPQRQ
jgi:hypothetical protein